MVASSGGSASSDRALAIGMRRDDPTAFGA
jgi:hypothetical protein